jgi:hypothetical protein
MHRLRALRAQALETKNAERKNTSGKDAR